MSKKFTSSPLSSLSNVFELIGERWMLVTAEHGGVVNTMTASWGSFGMLWNRAVCTCFIRPGRFTHELIEKSDYLSLSFLPEAYRNSLRICGTVSGRHTDKFSLARLTPDFFVNNDEKSQKTQKVPYISQAETAIICRKIYASSLSPDSFLSEDIQPNYPNLDYHSVFISEICEVLTAQN